MSRKKEIIKIKAQINKIESKNQYKNQWKQELALCKDKQDWQTFNQTHQVKKREDPNKEKKQGLILQKYKGL